MMDEDVKAAWALGWASLAIGAAEIFARRTVAKDLLGIDDHPLLLPALGLREIAAGATILSQTELTPTLAAGLWSRVAGDAVDGALLAAAAVNTRKPVALALTTAAVLGIVAADVYYAAKVQRRLAETPHGE